MSNIGNRKIVQPNKSEPELIVNFYPSIKLE